MMLGLSLFGFFSFLFFAFTISVITITLLLVKDLNAGEPHNDTQLKYVEIANWIYVGVAGLGLLSMFFVLPHLQKYTNWLKRHGGYKKTLSEYLNDPVE